MTSFSTAADIIVGKLRRMSDTRLRKESESWLCLDNTRSPDAALAQIVGSDHQVQPIQIRAVRPHPVRGPAHGQSIERLAVLEVIQQPLSIGEIARHLGARPGSHGYCRPRTGPLLPAMPFSSSGVEIGPSS
ncbi:hypothetical protein ACIRQQ_43230 [Streptomyces fuscichromogenes]|uniref:hypothetical protein n=1 Tax=Streptomyces fuscichromogenes TaxID=1324013 RepID=UPI0037FE2C09